MSEETERIVYSAIIDAKGCIHADAVNATTGKLSRWKGRHVTVTVSRYIKPKTNPQLGLYFREPDGILSCWEDYTGYTRDEMHKELKIAFLAPVLAVSRLTGEERIEMPSLADLNAEQMSTFLDRVIREGQERGIVFALDEAAS